MRLPKGKRITEQDRKEIERFAIYLRLANQAVQAGVPAAEAAAAIYPDAYVSSDDGDNGRPS